jgi:hypothetical protein
MMTQVLYTRTSTTLEDVHEVDEELAEGMEDYLLNTGSIRHSK